MFWREKVGAWAVAKCTYVDVASDQVHCAALMHPTGLPIRAIRVIRGLYFFARMPARRVQREGVPQTRIAGVISALEASLLSVGPALIINGLQAEPFCR
jgi:hypothetical protein